MASSQPQAPSPLDDVLKTLAAEENETYNEENYGPKNALYRYALTVSDAGKVVGHVVFSPYDLLSFGLADIRFRLKEELPDYLSDANLFLRVMMGTLDRYSFVSAHPNRIVETLAIWQRHGEARTGIVSPEDYLNAARLVYDSGKRYHQIVSSPEFVKAQAELGLVLRQKGLVDCLEPVPEKCAQ